ncbi:MAG: tetratricopeptide repeat protein [bacterium]
MKRISFLSLLVPVLLAFNGGAAHAQYDPEKQFSFLRDLYNRHDKNLDDYLIRELQQFLSLSTDSLAGAEAQFLMARVFTEKGDEHSALAAYLKTVFLYPGSGRSKEGEEAARKIITGADPYKGLQDKLLLFVDNKNHDPSLANRFYDYLQLLTTIDATKQYDWLLAQTAEFVRLFPQDLRLDAVYTWNADLLVKKNMPREAAASYLRLDYAFPHSRLLAYARYQRGVLLSRELGEHKAAIEALEQVITHHDTSAYAAPALFMLGVIKREKTKDYRGALAHYRKLVDSYPQNDKVIDALFAIGGIQAENLKDYPAAVVAYDEIVEKFKTDKRGAQALDEAAKVYKDKLQDYNKAAAYYAKITEIYPDDEKAPEVLLKAGVLCEEKLKDTHQAVHYYNSVLQKFPNHKKADEARKKLDKLQVH